MPTEVLVTSRADQQIASLTRRHSQAFETFLNDQFAASDGVRVLTGQPPVSPVNQRALAALDPHLVASECSTCGALFLDRRNACASCAGQDFTTRRLANLGVLRALAIVHRAIHSRRGQVRQPSHG